MTCSVPQGSSLSLLLFSAYMLLGSISELQRGWRRKDKGFLRPAHRWYWWFSQALRSRCPYASLPPLAGWLWALTDGSHQLDRCVHLPCSREAMKAVATLLEHSSTAWLIWNFPSGIQPRTTAATAARNPTTVACTWVTKEVIWKKKKKKKMYTWISLSISRV